MMSIAHAFSTGATLSEVRFFCMRTADCDSALRRITDRYHKTKGGSKCSPLEADADISFSFFPQI